MPHRCATAICCLLSLLFPLASLSQNAATNSPPPPAKSRLESWATEVKRPTDWFDWGADFRARNEYYDNIVTLTSRDDLHEQDVIRYRGRVWAALHPWPGLSLNTRLSAEPREWMRPAFVGAYRGQSGMEWRYGIFDILNLKVTNIFHQPLSVTVGRQDLAFGDYWNWWLVADGTPADGSWAFFLDSARLTYDAAELKTRFDAIGIYQQARPDDWLPTLGSSSDAYLTEQNEQGVILYVSNKSIEKTQIDGYFIYKHDEQELVQGDDADIYTVGGRVTGNPFVHWQYSVEGAYQFGEKRDPTLKDQYGANRWRDLDAYGANARLTYLFKDSLQTQLHLVFEMLSGDDPSTENDEMFDILWGRWPRFSEGYIYSYINETSGRVGQLNNIERIGLGCSVNPTRDLTLSAYYNAWFAPESTPTRARNASLFSGDGDFRGHYLQAIAKEQFSKHICAHLWGELIWAGDYYRDQPLMDFIRAEVQVTF